MDNAYIQTHRSIRHVGIPTEQQTDIQTYIQPKRQTDRQTYSKYRHTCKHTDTQTYIHKYIQPCRAGATVESPKGTVVEMGPRFRATKPANALVD